MKKCFIALACICLSACYYTVPTSDYYFDDGYVEPNYYSQTTYVTPSTSYVYVNDRRPDVVYINDSHHHHHHKPEPHRYYYPNHGSHHDSHKAAPKNHKPENLKIHERPKMGKGERVVRIPNDGPKHEAHHHDSHAAAPKHGSPHNGSHSPSHHGSKPK